MSSFRRKKKNSPFARETNVFREMNVAIYTVVLECLQQLYDYLPLDRFRFEKTHADCPSHHPPLANKDGFQIESWRPCLVILFTELRVLTFILIIFVLDCILIASFCFFFRAKMKGFPTWPGKVKTKTSSWLNLFIFFFFLQYLNTSFLQFLNFD